MHPRIIDILTKTLEIGSVTVLTNDTLLPVWTVPATGSTLRMGITSLVRALAGSAHRDDPERLMDDMPGDSAGQKTQPGKVVSDSLPTPTSPPRAFTQGVGTVFQFVGVSLFLAFFFTCCLSGLLSKDTATQTTLTTVGWGGYTAQRALSIAMVIGVFLGIALAGIGLGLQAQRRAAAPLGILTCLFATAFWIVHAVLFATAARSVLLTALAGIVAIGFGGLLALVWNAWREMRRNPPPGGFENLPEDYQVPYSHLHQDPPEVRMARELDERRRKLKVQQKELEMLEQRLRRKLDSKDDPTS